ncbi:acyl-CoA dehydrogenase family protein [Azoarcus sp. KH32C]|uniref:acyl-CoA dehydrogenase family protein n=1 Tax=Azoarcus sp. KH32C TaxID=748247 RepID=UPI00023864E4|nr:acyl-CoA dehydrogenase family protein [Azoarcus sp. KH32C]BAL24648.1 acyl-CoA dehydrogenase [Azoarcus sp. KH32C]
MNMDLETAGMLRDSASRYAADNYSFLQRHTVLTDPAGYSEKAWRDYAELGWLALRLPESHGGLEADPLAVGALMEVVGSRLLMEPVLASALVCTGLLRSQGSAAQQDALLPLLADGSVKLAFADAEAAGSSNCEVRAGRISGRKIAVLHGDVADRLIVSAVDADHGGERRLFLVDARSDEIDALRYRLVDGRGAANLRFAGVPAERLVPDDGMSAQAAVAEVLDHATVASCAEALGIVRALVATTCEYLKIRKQFGRPIGTNQALQHRAVDMFLLQEEIAALTRAAQEALSLPAAERARIVCGAKAYVCTAARHVANEAVQMHGGLGITEELDVSHYFRRLMVNAALFGSRDEHFARFLAATANPNPHPTPEGIPA